MLLYRWFWCYCHRSGWGGRGGWECFRPLRWRWSMVWCWCRGWRWTLGISMQIFLLMIGPEPHKKRCLRRRGTPNRLAESKPTLRGPSQGEILPRWPRNPAFASGSPLRCSGAVRCIALVEPFTLYYIFYFVFLRRRFRACLRARISWT